MDKALWEKMIEATCQYCKHFAGRDQPWIAQCKMGVILIPANLNRQECPYYEWQDRLIKEDFTDYG